MESELPSIHDSAIIVLFDCLLPLSETIHAYLEILKCKYIIRPSEKKESTFVSFVSILYFIDYSRLWIRLVLRSGLPLHRVEMDVDLHQLNHNPLNYTQFLSREEYSLHKIIHLWSTWYYILLPCKSIFKFKALPQKLSKKFHGIVTNPNFRIDLDCKLCDLDNNFISSTPSWTTIFHTKVFPTEALELLQESQYSIRIGN